MGNSRSHAEKNVSLTWVSPRHRIFALRSHQANSSLGFFGQFSFGEGVDVDDDHDHGEGGARAKSLKGLT